MHYLDRDPSPNIIDFGCGRQTYDGHDGIDFGITSLKQKTPVIASANCTILNLRDGVEDRLIAKQSDRNLIAGKECGNGVLIAHDNGWATQYCHMKKNSITVSRGTKVSKGTSLGMVGSSGLASFPHVHLTVRQNGKAIDPFVGNNNNKSCAIDKKPLWTDSIGCVIYSMKSIVGGSGAFACASGRLTPTAIASPPGESPRSKQKYLNDLNDRYIST